MRTTGRALWSLALATAVAACSSRTGATAPTPAGGTADVNVEDNQYRPASQSLAAGGTVRWTWRGRNLHTVTFDDGPTSSVQSSGTYQRTFAAAGTFSYFCQIHGRSMSGTVTVQ